MPVKGLPISQPGNLHSLNSRAYPSARTRQILQLLLYRSHTQSRNPSVSNKRQTADTETISLPGVDEPAYCFK